MTVSDTIGTIGVAAVLFAFFLLQTEKLGPKSKTYLMMNAIGSLGILFSLTKNFNFASFLIETCWVGISIYGLVSVWVDARQR